MYANNSVTLLFYSSLKIVDDDIDWKQMVKEEVEDEEDEEEAPVVRTKLTVPNYCWSTWGHSRFLWHYFVISYDGLQWKHNPLTFLVWK